MPYFLFKIATRDSTEELVLVQEFDAFRDAKVEAKKLRASQTGDAYRYKIMFAENQLAAEAQLLAKRDKPVLMEHER